MYVSYHVAKIGVYWLEMLAKLFKFTPVVTSRNIESTVTERVFSISKATDELGYVPKVDLECGIEETITWYKDNGYL